MDIIICTYNNASLLDLVLAKISLQKVSSHHKWAVIVVDNNCTDETDRIVDKHISRKVIPNLRRIVEKKQGLTYARLCGVKNAIGEWIAFVDDDCLLSENWVEQAIIFTSSHPNCGAFGGKVVLEWEITPSPILAKHEREFAASNRGHMPKRLYRNDFHIPGAGLVVQKAALEKSGWLDKQLLKDREGEKLTSGGDSEIVLRILNAGYELWYTPDCMLNHFVPIRRISEEYLVNMVYGFGAAAPYLTILRWNSLWVGISALRIVKGLIQIVTWSLIAFFRPSATVQASIIRSLTQGQIDGFAAAISSIKRMKNEKM